MAPTLKAESRRPKGRPPPEHPPMASGESPPSVLLPDPFDEPSFARKPSTTTSSPGFIAVRLMPRRWRTPGAPPEKPQLVTEPSAFFTST